MTSIHIEYCRFRSRPNARSCHFSPSCAILKIEDRVRFFVRWTLIRGLASSHPPTKYDYHTAPSASRTYRHLAATRRPQQEIFFVDLVSPENILRSKISNIGWRSGGPRARYRRRGKVFNGGSSLQHGQEFHLLGPASVPVGSRLDHLRLQDLRSIGSNKLFSFLSTVAIGGSLAKSVPPSNVTERGDLWLCQHGACTILILPSSSGLIPR